MKENLSDGKRKGHDTRRQKRSPEKSRKRTGLSRHLTPLKMGLGVVILGAALFFGPKLFDDGGTTPSRPKPGATTINPAPPGARKPGATTALTTPPGAEKPGVTTLIPAPPDTKVPINDVDPVTGKPITPSSPMKTYEGYVIAFCCAKSAGYTGWDRMSETEKEALVRRYLK